MGNLVRWVRALGFEGHRDQLNHVLQQAPKPTSSGVRAPAIVWSLSDRIGDVTLIRGASISQWDASARRIANSAAHDGSLAVPKSVFERPYALIGPAPQDLVVGEFVNSNSRTDVSRMWRAFEMNSESALVDFTLGKQLMELMLSTTDVRNTDAFFHLIDKQGLLATAQLTTLSLALVPDASADRVWEAHWVRRPSAATPPPQFRASDAHQVLGCYCRGTTSRLFKPRLQAAQFMADGPAEVAVGKLNEQALAVLVAVRDEWTSFERLAAVTGIEDTRLGNVLVGLNLCKLVKVQSNVKAASLYERTQAVPGRGLTVLGKGEPSLTDNAGLGLLVPESEGVPSTGFGRVWGGVSASLGQFFAKPRVYTDTPPQNLTRN